MPLLTRDVERCHSMAILIVDVTNAFIGLNQISQCSQISQPTCAVELRGACGHWISWSVYVGLACFLLFSPCELEQLVRVLGGARWMWAFDALSRKTGKKMIWTRFDLTFPMGCADLTSCSFHGMAFHADGKARQSVGRPSIHLSSVLCSAFMVCGAAMLPSGCRHNQPINQPTEASNSLLNRTGRGHRRKHP
mmetsp:Transcript_17488/g.48528  ORF Transcript_17488/g.48528 Transcript_17488/m.48528 type:complete len:193 (-) Transcript_17488:606-1184(-)